MKDKNETKSDNENRPTKGYLDSHRHPKYKAAVRFASQLERVCLHSLKISQTLYCCASRIVVPVY